MLITFSIILTILAVFVHPGQYLNITTIPQLAELNLANMYLGVAIISANIQYAVVLVKNHIDSKFLVTKPKS